MKTTTIGVLLGSALALAACAKKEEAPPAPAAEMPAAAAPAPDASATMPNTQDAAQSGGDKVGAPAPGTDAAAPPAAPPPEQK